MYSFGAYLRRLQQDRYLGYDGKDGKASMHSMFNLWENSRNELTRMSNDARKLS